MSKETLNEVKETGNAPEESKNGMRNGTSDTGVSSKDPKKIFKKKNDNKNVNDGGKKALKTVNKKKKKKIIKTAIIVIVAIFVLLFIVIKSGIAGSFINKHEGLRNAVTAVGLSDFFNLNETAKANTLTTYTVSTRTITEIIEGTGTIEPNASYNVTPLVSGEILEDYFEEGDMVYEDQPLYLIDSESGDSRITQLTNAVDKAEKDLKKAVESLDDLYIKSTVTGTIEKIYVEVGDDIKSGELLADVKDKSTMTVEIPFFAQDVDDGYVKVGDKAVVTVDEDQHFNGTVTEIEATSNPNAYNTPVKKVTIAVSNNGSLSNTTSATSASVNGHTGNGGGTFNYKDSGAIYATNSGEVVSIYYKEGQNISKNQYLLVLNDKNVKDNIETLENNVEDAMINLDDAKEDLDNYKIKAPNTGKIVTKSYKEGDTVSGNSNGGTTLAVIYDMTALKFTMYIDELDIDKLDEGQDVIVTCDSRSGQEYHGTITNISILGSTSNGTTSYPVEVTIENVEDESQRTVDEDGTIHKTYKTGMTVTEGKYTLKSSVPSDNGTLYEYENGKQILLTHSGELYDGDSLLREYGTSYTAGDNIYTFSSDYSTLTLEEQNTKGMLRIAMNVNAQIIVEKHENVIAVPQSAIGRGDVVKVVKTNDADKNDEKKNEKPNDIENAPDFENGENMPQMKSEYGTVSNDTEYEEVTVTTGASDDDYIEITSGLEEGDVVIIDNSQSSSSTEMQFGMMGGGMPGGDFGGGGMPSGGGMLSGGGGGMPGGGMGGGMR